MTQVRDVYVVRTGLSTLTEKLDLDVLFLGVVVVAVVAAVVVAVVVAVVAVVVVDKFSWGCDCR